MEEDTIRGSPGIVAVVERISRRSPSALLLEGSRSPAWGEPPLQWMAAEDPTSALFSLDDAAESMEPENLDIEFSAMMDALSQASGILREILVPTSRVSAESSPLFSLFFAYSRVFVFLIPVLFSVYH